MRAAASSRAVVLRPQSTHSTGPMAAGSRAIMAVFEGEVAMVRLDAEAALGDGVVVAAEEKAHVVAGLREARAVVGADRPGADDSYCRHGRRS